MIVRFDRRAVDAIVLDIEGTTTPIAFVTATLFPYVRRHLRRFLAESSGNDALLETIDGLHDEWTRDRERGERPPEWVDGSDAALAAYAEWLMDRDRKSTALKNLQGQIWDGGYASGALQGQVFGDVVPAFERWRASGIAIAIYSSGSEQAQRLLFAHTPEGDLTSWIDAFFDTTIGAKTSPDSYRRIAGRLRGSTARQLFVSDVVGELDAAAEAGCLTVLCAREVAVNPETSAHGAINSFDQISID